MVMPLSKVGSGGSKDQRHVAIKEKLLLVSDTIRKASVSEWCCQYFPQRCASGHYCKEKESGTEKALYLLYCLDDFFFFNPSPLVLSWRSYDEARSILEQRRMKWKGLLNLHLSWLSFNVFSSGLRSFNWSTAVVQDNGLPWPCYSSQLTWQWRKRPIIAISIKTSWLKAWEGQQGSGTNT